MLWGKFILEFIFVIGGGTLFGIPRTGTEGSAGRMGARRKAAAGTAAVARRGAATPATPPPAARRPMGRTPSYLPVESNQRVFVWRGVEGCGNWGEKEQATPSPLPLASPPPFLPPCS